MDYEPISIVEVTRKHFEQAGNVSMGTTEETRSARI